MMNRTRPRIGILHYAAPPTVGGVETTIAAHARLFADHGYAVKIIAGRGEPFDPRVPVEVIPTLDSRHSFVHEVNQKLARGIVTTDFHALTMAIRHTLQNALAEIDICIAHNTMTLHKNLALTNVLHEIADQQRVRLIAWCHDLAWRDPVYENDLFDGTPWDWLRQAWRGVEYVVVSKARQEELAGLVRIPPDDIRVVPPGIEPMEFLGVGKMTAEWARKFRLLDAAPLLLLPARVTRRKNIELAMAITAALRDRGLDPRLIVMGPLGPHNPANAAYLQELRAWQDRQDIQDAVIFLQEHGTVDDLTRRDLYWLADGLLFPSSREGFGIPILEAGLTRLPIFCADILPFRESAREWGHYFSLDDPPDLVADGIADFLRWDSRYQMKQRVLREYSWERIFAERIEPLFSLR